MSFETALPGPGAAASRDAGPATRRVVIVDDHELLRAGTRRLLEEAGDFAVVGEADDGERALALIARERPDIALVDIRLPSMNGIELAGRIVVAHPTVTVLILSAYDDENYVQAAFDAGVSGYLLKTTRSAELIAAILSACEGSGPPVRPPSGTDRAPDAPPGPDGPDALTLLTSRERDVVRLVARGLTNKVIAYRLEISPRTVEGHLNHAFEKLGTSSRTELAHFAFTHGLLRAPAPETGAGAQPTGSEAE